MCQKCADALAEYYPQLSTSGQETYDFMMCTTCFPFGDAEQTVRQLKEMREATDGSIGAAYAYADAEIKKALDGRKKASSI